MLFNIKNNSLTKGTFFMIKKTIFLSCALLSCMQAAQKERQQPPQLDPSTPSMIDILAAAQLNELDSRMMLHLKEQSKRITDRSQLNRISDRMAVILLINSLKMNTDFKEEMLCNRFNSQFKNTLQAGQSTKEINIQDRAYTEYLKSLMRFNKELDDLVTKYQVSGYSAEIKQNCYETINGLQRYIDSVNQKTSTEPA